MKLRSQTAILMMTKHKIIIMCVSGTARIGMDMGGTTNENDKTTKMTKKKLYSIVLFPIFLNKHPFPSTSPFPSPALPTHTSTKGRAGLAKGV